MGYGDQQVRDLEATIDQVPCDVVIVGTPIDLGRLVRIRQPVVRARYELQEIGQPDLATDCRRLSSEGCRDVLPSCLPSRCKPSWGRPLRPIR